MRSPPSHCFGATSVSRYTLSRCSWIFYDESIQRQTCRRALPARPEPLRGVRQMRNNSFLNSFHWNEFYFSKKNIGMNGAVEKTRTSTGCPTATSTLRVYQFRHDRTQQRGGDYPMLWGL